MHEFRSAVARLHEWAGFFIGWIVFAIALSGSLAVFRPEISQWMRPELATMKADPLFATESAVTWLQNNAANAPAWYLTLAEKRAPYIEALYFNGTRYVERALDPATGSPDTIRDTMGGDFFYRFHFELQLPHPFGRIISASCGLAIVLALITGVIVHKRIFADFFTLRFYKGQRSWLDFHNITSVVSLPFHFVIAFSGAMTLWSQILPASLSTAYPHNIMQYYTDLDPVTEPLNPTHIKAHLSPIGPMLHEAEKHFGTDGIAQVFIYNPNDKSSLVIIKSGNGNHIGYDTHTLRFDGSTGHILREQKEDRPIVTAFSVIYGLHIARFSNVFTRWLYFASGILLALAAASGLHLWVLRKKRQKQSLKSFKIIEKLNTSILYGLPISFSLFFIVNRLIPIKISNTTAIARSDMEIYSVFLSLFFFVFLGIVLKNTHLKQVLSSFGCAAFLFLCLMGYPWKNPIMFSTSLISIALLIIYAVLYKNGRAQC
ncbi:PepSY domain-containing protein [Neokomagataea tanensis]|uniref:PepSY domain-containing protein n=1 Tax=Neokomagataea tanensis TaxID=661191 RepID=A0A4Y6V661_9PROT|nr:MULTISPECIES: PepSY-associated TM helix domain-containing protein [Neokomagataea]QDH24056.1 PepSY domain-containing protein [Neokomagataea tanensis]